MQTNADVLSELYNFRKEMFSVIQENMPKEIDLQDWGFSASMNLYKS